MAANRILVVEDEKSISDFISINLQYTGYEYAVLADGDETVAYLKQDHSFDLALLDIMIPGVDGFELMKYMKQYNIPVIYLTAKSDVSSKIKGLRDGAEDYIVKPFEVLELLVRIEKVLERTGKLKKVLHFKDITIDVENHSVFQCGREIQLKPLEFDLFAMLVKYKNRTLPRERLLNEIWGVDFIGGTRTVDVHIAQLRKKLKLDVEIKTIPKIGYRLED
ncbi:MAG: response regulator transcription factor [Clostridiales bacterium]|nr:response regulator transcription factor [Clostridiales bacterium]